MVIFIEFFGVHDILVSDMKLKLDDIVDFLEITKLALIFLKHLEMTFHVEAYRIKYIMMA